MEEQSWREERSEERREGGGREVRRKEKEN